MVQSIFNPFLAAIGANVRKHFLIKRLSANETKRFGHQPFTLGAIWFRQKSIYDFGRK